MFSVDGSTGYALLVHMTLVRNPSRFFYRHLDAWDLLALVLPCGFKYVPGGRR